MFTAIKYSLLVAFSVITITGCPGGCNGKAEEQPQADVQKIDTVVAPKIEVGQKGREARSLVQSLQTRGAKPNDHIPEFAALALKHVDFIEAGLKDPANLEKAPAIVALQNRGPRPTIEWKPNVEAALKRVEALRHEAIQRIDSKNASYMWWFFFNLRLTAVADYGFGTGATEGSDGAAFSELVNSAGHDDALAALNKIFPFFSIVVDLVKQFPNVAFLPVPYELGLADFNEIRGSGGHFMGVSNGFSIADGFEASPFPFFLHDLIHAYNTLVGGLFNSSADIAAFMNDWQTAVYHNHAKDLSPQKREVIDLVYFLYHHEAQIKLIFAKEPRPFDFPMNIEFCEGCSKGTILDFFPKDIVKLGKASAEEWIRAASKETEEFFYGHRPDMRPVAQPAG